MKKFTIFLGMLIISISAFAQRSVSELGILSSPTDYGGTAIVPTLAPCQDTQPGVSFQQGRTFTLGSPFIPADDIVVAACESKTPQTLFARVFTQPGQNITSTTITFYTDNAGAPGAIIGSLTSAPVSQNVVGNNFGLDVHECQFDLTGSGIVLTSGATPTTYWFSLSEGVNANSTDVYWESEFTNPPINNAGVQSIDGGATWPPTFENQVFALVSDCQADTTPPVITCPGDQFVTVDANCNAILPDLTGLATATDNCGPVTVTQDIPAGTVFSGAGAVQFVNIIATDINGNTASCAVIVQAVDSTPPSITCPGDQILSLDANCEAALPDLTGLATAADNCGTVTVTQDIPAGTILSGNGSTLFVNLTATDGSGNTTSCGVIVQAIDDTAPTITCPGDQFVPLDANCEALLPDLTGLVTVSDNCPTPVSVTQDIPAGTVMSGAGSTLFVTLTATDGAGNTSDCAVIVQAVDITDPVIVCPANITADNDPGVCGATINFAPAIAIDNCAIASVVQTAGPATGSVFPIGTTAVEFTATDTSGNTAVCGFLVTVNDTEAPVIACQDITVELDANGEYSLTPGEVLASATDNCAITETGFSVVPAPVTECGNTPLPIPASGTSGAMDPSTASVTDSGVIGVDYTVDNVTLNIQHTWASDLIITLTSPGGTTLELSSNNGGSSGLDVAADLVFTDSSGNSITGWGSGAPAADYQPEGGLLNSVFDGEDINGNWTINIQDIFGGDSGTLNSYCISFSPMAVSLPTIDFTCANVGENTVTVYAVDAAGNQTTCTATVTVEDNIAPEITCVGAPGDVTYLQEFEGSTVPTDWTTEIITGSQDWEFGSGDLPIGDDFPTNAAIFDDDAAGPGNVNAANLISPVFDLSVSTAATLSYDVAFQEFGDQEFAVEVWDGAAWQQIALYTDDLDPNIQSETFDVSAYMNAAFQVRFAYDDLGGWGWHAGVDNFELTYNMPSTPLVVELDINGQATISASDLVMNVNEACGYVVTTVGGTPVPGSLSTIFGTNNNGAQGGAVYFDVTVGPEDLSITDIDLNTADAGAFTVDVYALEGSYVGNEGNAGAWTLAAVGSGTGAGVDQPSNAVLDTPVALTAGTTYGMALVFDATHAHYYTNGDGTNQNFSNADLSMDLGAASNVPFDGAPFSPRVFNGTLNYQVGDPALSEITFTCDDLGVSTVDIQVTDDSGNQAFCTASVEVVDLIDPILVCQDATIVLDEDGMSEVDPQIFLASSPGTYNVITISSDNQSGAVGTTDLTVDVTDAVTVSFDWDYSTDDGPLWDQFGYLLNGVFTELSDPNGANTQSGNSGPIDLQPGDVFGFRSRSEDGLFGACTTTISNFLPGFEGQFAPENWTEILTNSDGSATFVEIPGGPLSYDNCGITIYAVDVTDVTCDDIGQTITVTVFASDASGNLASCTANLTVVDETGPVIENCPEDMTVDPGPLNLFYELPDYWATTDVTATDNCTDPVTITSQDPAAGTLLPDGVYTITLTAEDEYGNASECSFELTIESILGLDDQSFDNAVGLYPNPANNFVNVANGSGLELERVAIYDMNGRLVQNVKLGNAAVENTIDVSYLASGVYVVQIVGEDNAQTVKRLVKE